MNQPYLSNPYPQNFYQSPQYMPQGYVYAPGVNMVPIGYVDEVQASYRKELERKRREFERKCKIMMSNTSMEINEINGCVYVGHFEKQKKLMGAVIIGTIIKTYIDTKGIALNYICFTLKKSPFGDTIELDIKMEDYLEENLIRSLQKLGVEITFYLDKTKTEGALRNYFGKKIDESECIIYPYNVGWYNTEDKKSIYEFCKKDGKDIPINNSRVEQIPDYDGDSIAQEIINMLGHIKDDDAKLLILLSFVGSICSEFADWQKMKEIMIFNFVVNKKSYGEALERIAEVILPTISFDAKQKVFRKQVTERRHVPCFIIANDCVLKGSTYEKNRNLLYTLMEHIRAEGIDETSLNGIPCCVNYNNAFFPRSSYGLTAEFEIQSFDGSIDTHTILGAVDHFSKWIADRILYVKKEMLNNEEGEYQKYLKICSSIFKEYLNGYGISVRWLENAEGMLTRIFDDSYYGDDGELSIIDDFSNYLNILLQEHSCIVINNLEKSKAFKVEDQCKIEKYIFLNEERGYFFIDDSVFTGFTKKYPEYSVLEAKQFLREKGKLFVERNNFVSKVSIMNEAGERKQIRRLKLSSDLLGGM